MTIRLVKGANMEMERAEASEHGWPQAPLKGKRETDANYKRMLHEGMLPGGVRWRWTIGISFSAGLRMNCETRAAASCGPPWQTAERPWPRAIPRCTKRWISSSFTEAPRAGFSSWNP